jgi:hypothetical protein
MEAQPRWLNPLPQLEEKCQRKPIPMWTSRSALPDSDRSGAVGVRILDGVRRRDRNASRGVDGRPLPERPSFATVHLPRPLWPPTWISSPRYVISPTVHRHARRPSQKRSATVHCHPFGSKYPSGQISLDNLVLDRHTSRLTLAAGVGHVMPFTLEWWGCCRWTRLTGGSDDARG